MWWSLSIILLAGLGALSLSDLEHASTLRAVVFPLVALLCVAAFALWGLLFLHRFGARQRRHGRRFDVGASYDSDGSGDGGGAGD